MSGEFDFRDEHGIIGNLLAKYPSLSAEETASLQKWLETAGNQQIFNGVLATRENDLKRIVEIKKGTEAARQKLYALIGAAPAEVKVRRINWSAYAAAASIVLVLSAGILWYLSRREPATAKTEETSAVATQDAAPGKFKAKLTLSDGTVLYLDSAANKLLAKQGDVAVQNYDGKVVYEGGNGKGEVLYNTLSTGKGETYATELSDGTKVWLNSQSSIRYPVVFNGEVRKVEMTGEGYFEVQKSKHPFVVAAQGMEVEVLGTHFNINAYADEAVQRTTLLEGKVKVRSAAKKETILQPGEQASYNPQSELLSKTAGADTEEAIAWHLGFFQFNNADLPTVMRQLARWYDMDVVYEGAVPEREVLGKIPRNTNLSQVLEILKMLKVNFKIEGKKIIVSP